MIMRKTNWVRVKAKQGLRTTSDCSVSSAVDYPEAVRPKDQENKPELRYERLYTAGEIGGRTSSVTRH